MLEVLGSALLPVSIAHLWFVLSAQYCLRGGDYGCCGLSCIIRKADQGGDFWWLEEVELPSAGDGAGATVRAELAVDVVDVLLDGAQGDEEGARDLCV